MINENAVDTMVEFRSNLYSIGVGNSVTVKVRGSDQKERDVNIKLEGVSE